MASYNDDLAAMTGQDKPCKDGSCADAAKRGNYAPVNKPAPALPGQARSTVNPLANVREK